MSAARRRSLQEEENALTPPRPVPEHWKRWLRRSCPRLCCTTACAAALRIKLPPMPWQEMVRCGYLDDDRYAAAARAYGLRSAGKAAVPPPRPCGRRG